MSEEEKDSKKKTEEELIAKSPGYGYLKVPAEIRKKIEKEHSLKVCDYPNPDAFFEFKEGKLELTYKFVFPQQEEGE